MLAKRLLWFLLILAVAPAAQTQPNRGHDGFNHQLALRGKVKLHNEFPIANAHVELRRATGEMMGLVTTNDDGQFAFPQLPAGPYVLTVTCAGFETVHETVDTHFADLQNYSVYLRRKSQLPDAASQPIVSVRELSLPHRAASAFRKGTEMLYEKHDVAASIRQFQEALRHYADYYEAHFQLGVAYSQTRRLDEAVEAFEKALQLSGHRYAPALIGLAAIANERRQFSEAAGLAQRGVDLNAELWQGHLELGRALLGLNKLEPAQKSLHQARALNPSWPSLYLLLANLHIRQNDPLAVQGDLEEYLRLAPDGPQSDRAREMLTKVAAIVAQSQPAAAPADKP